MRAVWSVGIVAVSALVLGTVVFSIMNGPITEDAAIEIARKAITESGQFRLSADAPVLVERRATLFYFVKFGRGVTDGGVGSSYQVGAFVDATFGKVVQIVGPDE